VATVGQRGEGDEHPERPIFHTTKHFPNRSKRKPECGTFEAQLTRTASAELHDLPDADPPVFVKQRLLDEFVKAIREVIFLLSQQTESVIEWDLEFAFRRAAPPGSESHVCAKVSASASPPSGLAWQRFCRSALLSSTTHCVAKYTLHRPHPDPSPVSGD
jgi:hypothetical protein